MGLSVHLTDEDGRVQTPERSVHDTHNRLARVLPSHDDTSFPFLRSIDPYGDTVFNRPQMEQFLKEWSRIGGTAFDHETRQALAAVESLAASVAAEPHLYLKFVGD